jgi:hypothetical protein
MNKYRFLFFNLIFGTVSVLLSCYLLCLSVIVAAASTGHFISIETLFGETGAPKYFCFAIALVAFVCGFIGLRFTLPPLVSAIKYVAQNGLPEA